MWAAAWLPIGGALAVYAAARPPQPSDLLSRPIAVLPFLLVWTLWGGVSGAAFSIILAFRGRRRTLGELSAVRTAAWGALGSMTAPAVAIIVEVVSGPLSLHLYDWRLPVAIMTLSGVLGAVCASLTLALARRRQT